MFADPTVTPAASVVKPGLLVGGGMEQLLPQIYGVLATGAYVFPVSIIAWFIIKQVAGLRVTREEELEGLDIGEHGNVAYPDFSAAETMES